jgi:hypothetical protein
MSYNTLDLDLFSRSQMKRIVWKIFRYCKDLRCADISLSSSLNGYHVELFCNKVCDLCRFVFDDPRRYQYDLYRPRHKRNVLFRNKLIFRTRDSYAKACLHKKETNNKLVSRTLKPYIPEI